MTYHNSKQKLDAIRAQMQKVGVDAFLVPQTDEYLGEYIPACAQRLAWLTGFDGSAGMGIIGHKAACVMSDGRYTIQLSQQIDLDFYQAVNSQEVSVDEWLSGYFDKNTVIGYDSKLHTPSFVKKLEEAGWILRAVDQNLVDLIWEDQPDAPCSQVFLFDDEYAGQTATAKIELFQDFLAHEKCDAVLLTLSDSIAWLLNIRGNDLPYIPVTLSYLILPRAGKVQWFVDKAKLNDEVKQALAGLVEFCPMESLENSIIALSGQSVWYDPKRSSIYFKNLFDKNDIKIIEGDDPVIYPRACKNKFEQDAMKAAHIRDGVALVRFLKWFDMPQKNVICSELTVEEKLESFRALAPEYKEPSFNTISGFGANGAIVHYRADEKSNKEIEEGNLLLLDSGAQYIDGTTDVTRTVAVGQPTDEMIKCNTLVLKGHIALAVARFKNGTSGKDLDALARAPLIAEGLNYSHGTGHGVGCYLSVHEEATSISPRTEEAMAEGMIVSNEPGYYKEGEFGIRIENLILCKKSDNENLFFETITFAPFDKNLMDVSILSDEEKNWINNYHQEVFDKISPHLDDEETAWLKNTTSKI